MMKNNELLSDAAVAGQVPATQTAQGVSGDGQLLQMEILQQLKREASVSCGGADGHNIREINIRDI